MVAWFAGFLIVVVVSPRLLAFIANVFLRCAFILRSQARGRSGGIAAAMDSNAGPAAVAERSTDGHRPIEISSVTIRHISPWNFSLGGIVIRMSDGIMGVRVRSISLGVRRSLSLENSSAGEFKPVAVLRVDEARVSLPTVREHLTPHMHPVAEREEHDKGNQGSTDQGRTARNGVVVSLPRLAARWIHLVALEINGLIVEENGTQSSSPRQTRLATTDERRELRDGGVEVMRTMSLGVLSIHGCFSRRVPCLSVSVGLS